LEHSRLILLRSGLNDPRRMYQARPETQSPTQDHSEGTMRRERAVPIQPLRKRVGIWIRVSTEDQAKGESPEHHEKRARAYAESKDWDVVELYDLAGVSGKSVSNHPECRRMMQDVTSRRIEGLIFSKLARLARDTKQLLEFREFFMKHDADMISLADSIDTSTPAGRL